MAELFVNMDLRSARQNIDKLRNLNGFPRDAYDALDSMHRVLDAVVKNIQAKEQTGRQID